MSKIVLIAMDEWRLWFRTKLAIWSVVFFFAMLCAVGTSHFLKITTEQQIRSEQQHTADQTFFAQPDRHPHRMVHYGHYAFRAPSPMSIIDPGLDAVTGQSIFLEGHRQNSAVFNESEAAADLGGLSWLSPALIYQWFAPLLLILLGYGAVVRERESTTLSTLLLQSVSGVQIISGKLLALLMMTMVLLMPMFITATFIEGVVVGTFVSTVYVLYLSIWSAITIIISSLIKKRSSILVSLISVWILICLLVPSIAVDFENNYLTHKGKIESDLQMLNDMRKLGDGHNSNDPAFASIRANLLAQYDVDKVEDLPVNIRGIVAKHAEEKLTKVLNEYADQRIKTETEQAARLAKYGWVSPYFAMAKISRSLTGTDLYHYHQFLKDTEALRYDFVQGLNDIHAKQLAYQDDINRSSDHEAEKRTRMSADNWQILESYQFQPAAFNQRINNAEPSLFILLTWVLLLMISLVMTAKVLKP